MLVKSVSGVTNTRMYDSLTRNICNHPNCNLFTHTF